jgi:hypothetical protein
LSRLDVHVSHIQRVDEAGVTIDLLHVVGTNVGGATTIRGCAILLPLGLRIYSDPPQPDYPADLERGAQCSDFFDCRELATRVKQEGYTGKVRLVAMFLEAGGPLIPHSVTLHIAPEDRSDPFAFDVDRWL